VRRVIRSSDQLLIDEGTGVAIIFPEVDQPGIQTILERIYRSVSLLRAETVIPPLKRETDIVIGIGSHLEAGTSLEHLLSQTSTIARKLTLRPAIASHFWGVMSSLSEPEEILLRPPQEYKDAIRLHEGSSVPFMELPTQLPRRLKQLIPYHIALELYCAPVGRDHHCLT